MRSALRAFLAGAILFAAGRAAAADFSSSTLDDLLAVADPLEPGDYLMFRIDVRNNDSLAATDVKVTQVFDSCLDLTSFDPVARPADVLATPGPATTTWTLATRTLEVLFPGTFAPSPGGDRVIVVRGLRAGPSSLACCHSATIAFPSGPMVPTLDKEIGRGPTCHVVSTCAPRPDTVQGLLAVRSGANVDLAWLAARDAVSYGVYGVMTGDETRIPFAGDLGMRSDPSIQRVATVLAPATAATDIGAVTRNPPALIHYQVRSACVDGSEGPEASGDCSIAATVRVSATRPSVPTMSTPRGSCAFPDLLPIRIEALVLDAAGSPVAGCAVRFRRDDGAAGVCQLPLGEPCRSAPAPVTDALGIAAFDLTVTQADFDFCNCLPSGTRCAGLCSHACAPACGASGEFFCGVDYQAIAGTVRSPSTARIEYGF